MKGVGGLTRVAPVQVPVPALRPGHAHLPGALVRRAAQPPPPLSSSNREDGTPYRGRRLLAKPPPVPVFHPFLAPLPPGLVFGPDSLPLRPRRTERAWRGAALRSGWAAGPGRLRVKLPLMLAHRFPASFSGAHTWERGGGRHSACALRGPRSRSVPRGRATGTSARPAPHTPAEAGRGSQGRGAGPPRPPRGSSVPAAGWEPGCRRQRAAEVPPGPLGLPEAEPGEHCARRSSSWRQPPGRPCRGPGGWAPCARTASPQLPVPTERTGVSRGWGV